MTVTVDIGPVPSAAVLDWVANAREILGALRRCRESLPFSVPPEVVSSFLSYLDEWERAAHRSPSFRWHGEASSEQVRSLVHYWFNIDSLDDVTARRLGIRWAPRETRAFRDALVNAVLDGLARDPDSATFAVNLRRTWGTARVVARHRDDDSAAVRSELV